MTQGEVIELFKAITLSYPAFRVPDELAKEQILHWHQHLKDVPFDVAMANFREHVQTERFPPTIADIRRGYSAERTVPGAEETRRMLAEMDEMAKRAVTPPAHIRERVMSIVARRNA